MPHDIDYLIRGYKQFRSLYFNGDNKTYEKLVHEGQNPKVVMIACSDSRVDPAIVMNCEPGDLFVIRNVANLVPPYENEHSTYHGTSAALEFAICTLNIRHVIVLGHTQCGGIRALIEHANTVTAPEHFISKWMGLARPAHDFVMEHYAHEPIEKQTDICSRQALLHSLSNLRTFPWIAAKEQAGNLFLHAWQFDLSEGIIRAFNEASQEFQELGTAMV